MTYIIEIKPSCKDSIAKLSKKNPVLQKALENKIGHILENPLQFKPLRYGLSSKMNRDSCFFIYDENLFLISSSIFFNSRCHQR